MIRIYLKKKGGLNTLFRLAIMKNIDKKKIIISKNCRFFIAIDSILSLENN